MLLLHVVACRFKVRCCTLSGRIQLFPCHVIVFGCQQVISTKECKSRCPACVLEACLVKAKPNMAKKYKDASLISCFPCIVTVGEMLLSATELGGRGVGRSHLGSLVNRACLILLCDRKP